MKKSLIALISIACISSMLFVGCRVDSDDPSTTTQNPVGGTRAPQTEITTDAPDATTVPTQLTTAAPNTTSEPSVNTTNKPTVTTSPSTATGAPIVTTAPPTTSAPNVTTVPSTTTSAPIVTTAPSTTSAPNVTTVPSTTTDTPTVTTVPTPTTTKAPFSTEFPSFTTSPQTTPSTPTEKDEGPFTVTEKYLPADVAAEIRTMFEQKQVSCSAYAVTDNMPYAMADVVSISAGKMLSITIPVVKTGAADANGDFILTMYIVGNTDTLLKSQTYRTVQLKVNGAKYGLSANTNDVYRFIKLDLTDYGIVLTDKQTVAFFSSSDTLYPAYLGSGNTILNFLKNEFPRAVGYYNGAGKSTLKASANALLFDFEFERTYETKEERDMAVNYYDVLAAVKKAYGGKLFSVLGDSISTYDGFCNNSSVNSNLASNVKLYPYGNVADYTHTYWGALIGDTGMSLCVNNAWSGSHVVGTDKWSYADNMVYRAEQLARDSGEKPDVIFAFMSTNDLIHSKPLGSLYTLLSTNDGRSDSEKIEAWFSAVQRPASTKTAFAYWDEAYALSLQTMKQKYPDAEIFCMTLLPNTNSGYNTADRAKFNRCISALAEYFGANLIDLNESKIDSEHLSTTTVDGLHPNMIGFAEIEKTIIKALYKKISA